MPIGLIDPPSLDRVPKACLRGPLLFAADAELRLAVLIKTGVRRIHNNPHSWKSI